VEVKDIKGEGVGTSFKLVYKMLGRPFDVVATFTVSVQVT
jgi:hypothetical protein